MSALPAGPRAPRAVQSVHYALDPLSFFRRARRRHGSVFTVRVFAETWVIVADPDVVSEILRHGPEDLNSGEANLTLSPVLGTGNVLLLDGAEHLARRRLLLPPFHGERMRSYAQIIKEEARREIARWPQDEAQPSLGHMQAITLEVILRAVFGVDDARRLERLRAVLRELLAVVTDPRRLIAFAALGPERIMRVRSFRRRRAAVDEQLLGEIRRRRDDPGLADREDILSLLLQARDEHGEGLSDTELRDELMTLLVAGHETTAALLAWTVQELARRPDEQERLAAGEEGYADAVVQEALRLHPPVPLIVRRLRRPMTLGGLDLPAGATVAPCALLLHEDPALFPEPVAFRPSRFLEGRPRAGAYLPFGGGVRRCIGAAFAQFEARIVLEELAAARRLAPASARPERIGRRGVVLVPHRGGRVVAARREVSA